MALTLFWRCESSTLDATHDYSVADNVTQGLGSPSYDATGGIGGGGALQAAAATQGGMGFSANNLITGTVDGVTFPSTLQFAMGCSFKYTGTISGSDFSVPAIWNLIGAGSNDALSLLVNAAGKLEFHGRKASGTIRRVALDHVITASQWYGVVVRYDLPNNYLRVELYTHSGAYGAAPTLVASVEPTFTDWADYTPAYIATGAIGTAWYKQAAQTAQLHWDNCMLASNHDEPLENNLTIESYQDYSTSTALSVTAALKELDGITNLPTSLTDVRWAWFDIEPGTAQAVPTDYNTNLTIASGFLEVTLVNSSLTSGQYGYLVLEHQASGRRQAYRLQVTDA